MPPAKTVAYVASHSAVGRVLDGGFVAMASGSADQPVVLREVGQDVMDGVDGQAVLLLEVPDELVAQLEAPTESGGPARAFSIPASVADRFPVLAYRAEGTPASSRRPSRPSRSRTLAAIGLVVLALVGGGVVLYLLTNDDGGQAPQAPSTATSAPDSEPTKRAEARQPPVAKRSRAVGSTTDGSLLNGVPLPPEGENFFTWDIPRATSPNPRFRRFGTLTVVQRTRATIAAYRRGNPRAPRVGIADLSLPKGGEFGTNFGGTGHVGHRNGTEVDILYPRLDRAERATGSAAEVNRRLAQELLDRFLEAGAVAVVVDAGVGLEGDAGKIETAPFHEDHMHIRFPAR